MKKFEHLYTNDYFAGRNLNDRLRIRSFLQEKELLLKYVDFSGKACDVGCSTGEFLKSLDWTGERYGMEISKHAIEIAKQNGVSFEKNIETEKNFFDLVIFRGTIQHLPAPFVAINNAYEALKPGGIIAFLATPNSNSIVYKLTNTLPVLAPSLNFYIPSDITLINACKNIGFELAELDKPYLKSPYAKLLSDHLNFIKLLFFRKHPKFSFWGNMMNLIMEKKV